jgi:hypothetical protein
VRVCHVYKIDVIHYDILKIFKSETKLVEMSNFNELDGLDDDLVGSLSNRLDNLNDKLKTFYQSIKIDKPLDPAIIEKQKKRKEEARLARETLITNKIDQAMETISKNKNEGYCILSYDDRDDNIDGIIAKALEKAGFTVQRTSEYGNIIRRILIVYWQEYSDTFKESQLQRFDFRHRYGRNPG